MSDIDVLLTALNGINESVSEIKRSLHTLERNQRALRPVLEAFHRSQTVAEECLVGVACDAAQARHNGHKMNNLAQALATGVDLLLDSAGTTQGSSDSIKAARDSIREAVDRE